MEKKFVIDIHTYLKKRIIEIYTLLRRIERKEMGEFKDITPEQHGILLNAAFLGREATPYRISKQLVFEPHSVSVMLTRMEKRGLIKKIKDLNRRNLVRIEITNKGHEYLKDAQEKILDKFASKEMFSLLSDEEKRNLASYLERILDKMVKHMHLENKKLDVVKYR